MSAPARVLVVDDEEVIRDSCQKALERCGHEVETARDAFEALKLVQARRPDVVVLDLRMPGMGGEELLRRLRTLCPQAEAIVVTGYSSVPSAVDCMRLGACDYLPKPFDVDSLRLAVARALEKRRLVAENDALRKGLRGAEEDELLGDSPSMQRVRELIERVAPTQSTVLVLGESGTGKELVARAIHRLSPRRDRPFLVVDCGALVETLCEAELFGHVKGAFTGATAERPGRFVQADGGSLFLDELGNLDLALQAKLLRVLQEREITPVGGNATVRVDVRILAATNRDLRALIAAGRFREDLFYRLSVVVVPVPPLRERREEIPALARALVERLVRRKGFQPRTLGEAAVSRLVEEAWPGNVRELENALERALVLARGPEIGPEDLPLPRRGAEAPSAGADRDDLSLSGLEAQHVRKVLEMTGWRVGRAAALLGIDRKTLSRKVREYGLRERGRNAPGGGESPPPLGRDAPPPRDAGR